MTLLFVPMQHYSIKTEIDFKEITELVFVWDLAGITSQLVKLFKETGLEIFMPMEPLPIAMEISMRDKFTNLKNMDLENICMPTEMNSEGIGDTIKKKEKGSFGLKMG